MLLANSGFEYRHFEDRLMSHLRFYRAILSHDYHAIKSQPATVQLHSATLSRKQTKPTRLVTIFLRVV